MFESGENYLETIYTLTQKNGYVRSVDIAAELSFSKPSVSRAMSILKGAKYVEVERNGNILLTEKGLKKAIEVYTRHRVIKEFLVMIGVGAEVANTDACKIEHIISSETFEQIRKKVEEKK